MTQHNAIVPDLEGQHIVIVGGGSGMGKATARLAATAGAKVTIASRDQQKLNAAAREIGHETLVAPVDMTDPAQIKTWAQTLGPVDHLIITASSVAHGTFADAPVADIRAMFDAKFFGPYTVAKEILPFVRAGGSMTFFSGVLSRRPALGTTGLSAVNAAVEGLVRGLALELGSDIRVNGISPGMADTDAYAGLSEERRLAMFKDTASSLPLGRVGHADDIAPAVLMLATNTFMTGHVLDIDGGHMVRQ